MLQNNQPPPATPHEWHAPLPEKVPKPTIWPAALSLGACLAAWGLVASWVMSVAGLILFILSCRGWVRDLREGSGDSERD